MDEMRWARNAFAAYVLHKIRQAGTNHTARTTERWKNSNRDKGMKTQRGRNRHKKDTHDRHTEHNNNDNNDDNNNDNNDNNNNKNN
jgi:hypothetical protein